MFERNAVAAVVATVLGLGLTGHADAQSRPVLAVERGDGSTTEVSVSLDRGFAAVELGAVADLGWVVDEDGSVLTLSAADEIRIAMRVGSPFFRWDGVVLQMTDAPYRAGRETYVPLQFLSDFLPRRLPGLYDFSDEDVLLRAGDVALLGGADVDSADAESATDAEEDRPAADDTSEAETAADSGFDENSAEAVQLARPSTYDGTRVVVIDAGHGGADPGSLSPDGLLEKDIALAVALRLRDELQGEDDLEIVMIREDDTFVEIWDRGLIATRAKGERPGIFVSIHANSFPARRAARGFETYFLSDARTEHERRVSAIENAPISRNPAANEAAQGEDLDFILRDLRNYDHAHWSENLAGFVQEELDDFHPGPNRGVKQGVLAVLTNALMPSVLIELGYLSNQAEAELMAQSSFYDDSAEAIAEAVLRFFERYPPGSGVGGRTP
ncbi:MAG: N-acetylmuramoyl-L-alanine amidase [Gemmatimonadota bacterium]